MFPPKREHPKIKSQLHPRNKHRERYDFKQLTAVCPELAQYVSLNKFDDESIDFFNPEAVKMLNKALLKRYYNIAVWDIPHNYLCPPIPGRADYIHYMADLLGSKNKGVFPTGDSITCLDIGVGANCVYPIIGSSEYGWHFVGSDIDPVAVGSARCIVEENPSLNGMVELRMQNDLKNIFHGIIRKDERFDLTVCNPPFHSSPDEAQSGTARKLTNLTKGSAHSPILNFGGQNNELWCEGGEVQFVHKMIRESKQFASSCLWFSTLISKESSLRSIYETLQKVEALEVKTIPMGQGNKISRIVAWTFLSQEQQLYWSRLRWG